MAKQPKTRRRGKSNAAPFLDLLEQMEGLVATIELDWPEDVRADVSRRLSRLARAVRHAVETSQRL